MAEVGFWTWNPITSLPGTAVLPVTINPTGTPVSKTITGASLRSDLRGTLFNGVMFVPPSGVTDDSTDYDNIMAAAGTSGVKTILLSGTYYSTEMIVLTGQSLIGLSRATINYIGAATTDYLVKIIGGTDTGYIENVALRCNLSCRGLQIYYTTYRKIIDTVRISYATQIACDLIDCWGSDIDGLTISTSHGIALRMHRCNSFSFQNYHLATHACFWSSDTEAVPNATLWAAACDTDLATAQSTYAAVYTEDWPAVDDTSVVDSAGASSYVQTAAEDRAPIVIASSDDAEDSTVFDNIMCEACYCADYPVISIKSNTTSFRNVRFENGYHRVSLAQVIGDGGRQGSHITFDGVYALAVKPATELLRCFTDTNTITVRNFAPASYVTTNVVVFDGGSHDNVIIEGLITAGSTITAPVALVSGATLAGTSYKWGDIILDSTTGTKIGTAATQKLGFFNATPIIQPTVATDATVATLIEQLALLGLIKNA